MRHNHLIFYTTRNIAHLMLPFSILQWLINRLERYFFLAHCHNVCIISPNRVLPFQRLSLCLLKKLTAVLMWGSQLHDSFYQHVVVIVFNNLPNRYAGNFLTVFVFKCPEQILSNMFWCHRETFWIFLKTLCQF